MSGWVRPLSASAVFCLWQQQGMLSRRAHDPDQNLQPVLFVLLRIHSGGMGDVRGHIAAQPFCKCFLNLPPFAHSILWNLSGVPCCQYSIWIPERAYFLQSWRKISPFTHSSGSLMVMLNKSWSLVQLLLTSSLPSLILCFQSFSLLSIHRSHSFSLLSPSTVSTCSLLAACNALVRDAAFLSLSVLM